MYQRLANIRDTFEACNNHAMQTVWYLKGDSSPHYPVPALMEHDPWNYTPQRLVDLASMRMAAISYAGY